MTREPFAFLLRTTHPEFARRFLGRLANAIAGAPPGAAVLVERAAYAEEVSLALARNELAPSLHAAASGLPVELRRVARRPPPTPSSDLEAAFLVPDEEVEPSPVLDRAEPRPPGLRLPSAADQATLQSHWFPDRGGLVRVWVRMLGGTGSGGSLTAAVALAERLRTLGTRTARAVTRRLGRRGAREWSSGALGRLRGAAPLRLPADLAAALVPLAAARPRPETRATTMVLGASGTGKTAYLTDCAVRAIDRGAPAVVVDLHGDLAIGVLAALPPARRGQVVAIEAGLASGSTVGIDVLGGPGRASEDGVLIAALKRLTSDGTEIRWGFRIERLLGQFLRIAREEGGSLLDLAELLLDARRREAARRTVRSPDLARFLDDLAPLLRRYPEYLEAAASRVAPVLADPRLASLLAPRDGGVPIEEILEGGRSILVRMPFDRLGPERTGYAAALLATRFYLTLVRLGRTGRLPSAAWLLWDEAHLLPPRLLTEAVGDARKFGVRIVLASQYPERLAPELRSAVEGAAGRHLVFRVPFAAARASSAWAGLAPAEAEELLPRLPVGVAVTVDDREGPRLLSTRPIRSDPAPWEDRAGATALAWGGAEAETEGDPESALWMLWTAEVAGRSVDGEVPADVDALLRRRGYLSGSETDPRVTEAGRAFLGLGRPSGATTESGEHRRLLLAAQVIFARHGERLEIVRQGRFDTRLPDGLLRLLPERDLSGSPAELARRIAERSAGWAWRAFGGRDVHVEAEVSGAERPERIRRGLAKARQAHASVVFAVGTPAHARRVRAALDRSGATRSEAQVWTLRPGDGPPPGSVRAAQAA